MQELNNLFDKLCDELCEYGQKDLSQDSLKVIDTLAHAAKNVLKVMEGCEGGGSYAYYDEDPRNTAMGSYRSSYGRGGSYRMSHKRDSMGRYSRAENGGDVGGTSNAGVNMSNRGGYSRGGNNVTDGLRELMYAAPPEMQGEINRLIKKLDNM